MLGATHIWKSLAGFGFKAKLFFDKALFIVSACDRDHTEEKTTYSAAVCESSEACEMELVRGLGWVKLEACESVIATKVFVQGYGRVHFQSLAKRV